MFEWLASTPLLFQIIFSVLILGCCLFVVIILVKRGFEFGKGKLKFSVGTQKKEEETKKRSPHAECYHSKDIIILINEILRLTNDKFLLQEKTKTRHQANYAEQKLDQVRALFQKIYLDELSTLNHATIGNQSISIYRLILKDIQSSILRLVIISFQEDALENKSEKEFQEYFSDKFEFISSKFSEFLDYNYFYNCEISRERLFEINNKFVYKLKEMIQDIYEHARAIALENKVKVLELDERIEQCIQQFVG